MAKWFIYVLRDPRTYEVRYVGFTVDPCCRFSQHLEFVDSSHKSRWIKLLLADGACPIMNVIEEGIGDSWKEREKYWIATFRSLGDNLTNMTDGGDGCFNPSPEVRQKMRLRKLGRKRSPESIARSAAGNRGRTCPEHVKEAARRVVLGRRHTSEEVMKCSRSLKGKPWSQARREAQRS